MESIMNDIAAGNITWVTAALMGALGLFIGVLAGAAGGVIVGGKHMGRELAAMMGGFFGPVAAVPGVLVALAILMLV